MIFPFLFSVIFLELGNWVMGHLNLSSHYLFFPVVHFFVFLFLPLEEVLCFYITIITPCVSRSTPLFFLSRGAAVF